MRPGPLPCEVANKAKKRSSPAGISMVSFPSPTIRLMTANVFTFEINTRQSDC